METKSRYDMMKMGVESGAPPIDGNTEATCSEDVSVFVCVCVVYV